MKKFYRLSGLLLLLILCSRASAQAPYCLPEYTFGCANGDGLTNFQLGTINQAIECNGSPNSYYNYYNSTTDLLLGGTYTLSATTGTDSTCMSVWIDWDDNMIFDLDESIIFWYESFVADSSYSFSLQIPNAAIPGMHRMRFRTQQHNQVLDACYPYMYGNAGDFTVNLVAPSPPGIAQYNSPVDGASGVFPSTNLIWAPGPGWPPSGYYLYLGTDNPPTNIVNGTLLTSPFYNPIPDLLLDTTYYWKVVPFNSGGQAASVPVWSFTTISGYGTLQGHIFDCANIPIEGAVISASGPSVNSTVSDESGFYQFIDIPAGSYVLSGQAPSYNTINLSGVMVHDGITTVQNATLTQPTINVSPNPLNITINPNEEYTSNFTINNTGCGPLNWSTFINYGSSNHEWCTMPFSTGVLPAATVTFTPIVFNAGGLAAGTIMNATVIFNSVPEIGTVIVPVSMTVSGPALAPATNLQAVLTNELTGAVSLSWECTPGAGFMHYTVERNGTQIAVIPADTSYSDILPDYGNYTYCVYAVYTEGSAISSCSNVEWSNPVLTWAPAELSAIVFPSMDAHVHLTIGNSGQGTLSFEFPDWSDHPVDSPLAYCPASATTEDEFISNVTFGTLNNTTGWSEYSDFTIKSTEIVKNISYPVVVTIGPPSYSGDITGVWIDFDHSNTFDVAEFFALTGTSPATGTITVPSTALTGPTTMRVRTQHNGTLSPCGTTQYGEVEDYTVIIREPSFITMVMPSSGNLVQGQYQDIQLTFSATGEFSDTGVYTNILKLASNDVNQPLVNITATMIVGMPSYLNGIVTEAITGNPLAGVLVQAGINSTMTNDAGAYSILVVPGTYNVVFSKLGLQSLVMPGIVVSNGGVATLNAQLSETPYPPGCAYASVDLDDSACTVSWCLPTGPYEMLYDDGTPENYSAWALSGSMNAVKFTPQGYPATITGARFHITYQGTGSILSTTLTAMVCKADAAGLPGNIIDSTTVTVSNLGWVDVTGLNATLTDGDFFIVMRQNEPSPECPYLSVDETLPTAYKSYSRNLSTGGAWGLSAYQDFMIRAIVSSPVSGDDDKMESQPKGIAGNQEMKVMINTVEGSDYASSVSLYSPVRLFLGATNPVTPPNGSPTFYSNSFTATTYTESGTAWVNMQPGWYAYGIKAVYPGGQSSEYTYTNIVPHNIFANLTINAQLDCSLVPADGAIVTITGIYYPYYSITDTMSSSGSFTFSQIIQGEYTISVTYPGYETFTQTVSLFGNEVVNAVLLQSRNKPIYFQVGFDLVASWQEPRGIFLSQNFESNTFPPTGWQSSTQGITGWFSTTNGSSDSLVIPAHSTYAVTNDQLGGTTNNGCCDYLITPALELRGAPDYTLTFNSFFNGLGGQLAFVEMSTDNGATWTPIHTCFPTAGYWLTETVDLTAYSGPSGLASVRFAFHADDAGNLASGWAIDDVMITYGGLQVLGYKVYLDGTEMGQTAGLTWTFDPMTFSCQDYQAAVEAIYCTGVSDPATDDFTNGFIYPPANLSADTSITTTSGAVILTWQIPMDCLSNVVGYHLYRDDVFLAQVPATDTIYWDMNLMPKTYCYDITTVYDLTPYGMPGQLAESIKAGPDCADIIYGSDLPFYDDFSGGAFDTTMWNPGQNWLVDEDSDNPVPAAKFKWDPLMTNYSSALQSTAINISEIDTTTPFKIYFDYEIKLEDFSASGSEKLTVEIWNGSGWNAAKEYTNTCSFDWAMEHLDITTLAGMQAFMVRFRANGSSSDAIHYWAVDNVSIYAPYADPPTLNLVATLVNPSGNDVHLIWSSPSGGGTLMSYILDDNSAETGILFNSAGEYWIGNEFSVSDQGVLQSASVFLNENGSATYSFDVFDETGTLVGSSAAFSHVFGDWSDVALPDIPFYGKFYLMLHIVVSTQSAILAYDTNGPYAVSDLEWFYDGAGWLKLSANGIAPGVCMIRATGLVDGKKTAVTFGPGSAATGYISPLASRLVYKDLNINTVNEIAQVTILSVNSDSITGYNVYRRSYSVYPAGQNNANSGEWKLIAFVLPTEFTDSDLSNQVTNCYEYQVEAVYFDGDSLRSNIDWECIFTEVKPSSSGEVKLYPNPATTFIRIELNGDITDLKVFNSLGLLVTEKNLAGEITVVLNTSAYAAGMYTAKFTTRQGESFSRKFVVVR